MKITDELCIFMGSNRASFHTFAPVFETKLCARRRRRFGRVGSGCFDVLFGEHATLSYMDERRCFFPLRTWRSKLAGLLALWLLALPAYAADGGFSVKDTITLVTIALAVPVLLGLVWRFVARGKPLMPAKRPDYLPQGATFIALKKGYDLPLLGAVEGEEVEEGEVHTFAVQPPDIVGMSPIPKVLVEVGDVVKAGDPLFFDKRFYRADEPRLVYVAPVSGEVVAINRGEKRSIVEVVILKDKQMQYREMPEIDLEKASREELYTYLHQTGGWSLIRQRPYNTPAHIMDVPRDIFISTFSTGPLAPDQNVLVKGREELFQKGLDVLAKMTEGKVYLGLDARGRKRPSPAFSEARGVEKFWFSGPHPAGNVGVQIHHIARLKTREQVWTLSVQEVISLGALFAERCYKADRIVAITGELVKRPRYVRTYQGANLGELLKDNLESGKKARIISGDVLSGRGKSAESFLGFYDEQVTVIEEGDYYELFGWLLPSKLRPTVSQAYLRNWLNKGPYYVDTNTHGERRAFVMTGQYEAMLPMKMLVQPLFKAIIVNDYDEMEGLGVFELVEEDVALCEFACTSKQPLQKILRRGLDMMREQS